MRRVVRYAYLAFSLACLLFALALTIVWVRGQWMADWYQWHRTDEAANTWHAWDVVTGKSYLYVSRQEFIFERPGRALEYARNLKRINGVGHMTSDPQSVEYSGSFWSRLGFGMTLE